MAPGNFGDLVEPMIHRVSSDAVGQRLETDQILFDLPRIDRNVGPERILITPEWSIGYALKLLGRSKGRGRHFNRGAEPSPGRDDRGRCQRKKNRPKAHWRSLLPTHPARLRLSCGRDGAKNRMKNRMKEPDPGTASRAVASDGSSAISRTAPKYPPEPPPSPARPPFPGPIVHCGKSGCSPKGVAALRLV